jgi:5'-nucleotidase
LKLAGLRAGEFRVRRRVLAAALAVVLAAGACSGDDDSTTATTLSVTTTAPGSDTTSPSGPSEPLDVLVSNDDGIAAPGIDALVQALAGLDGVEVTVVAPSANQSGSTDTTTPGSPASLTYAPGETASGVSGTAVDGFPADSVLVALDVLGATPDLVVSGVNEGQNVGPLVLDVSGTVGAARTASRRGIPSLALSAGLGEAADYDSAVRLGLDWIDEHRAGLASGPAGTAPVDVVNINVPTCTAGEMHGLVDVPVASAIPEGLDIFHTDCAVVTVAPPADDVSAIAGGYASRSEVPPG